MHTSLEGNISPVPRDAAAKLDTRDDKFQYFMKYCKHCRIQEVHRFGKPVSNLELGTPQCEWGMTREDIAKRDA